MLDTPNRPQLEAPEEDIEVRRTWRQKWEAASAFDKVTGVTVAAVLLLLIVLGLIWTLSPSPAKQGSPRLIGGMEVPLAEAINKGIDQKLNPRFQKIEDGQKKTDQNVDALTKRVIALEAPPAAFNYQLLTDTIAGKK